MTAIRITCWLTAMALGAVSLNWAVRHGSEPGETTTPAMEVSTTPREIGGPGEIGGTALKGLAGGAPQPLELTVGLGGFRMPCKDCHSHLGSPAEEPVQQGRGPHGHVVLEHGGNNRCFNCHHPHGDQYGSFVSYDGSVIPLESVEQLCGKCHGPHYRAWKQGGHGQWTGYWNLDLGPRSTARCNACHDPHRPYFKPVRGLPGPRSLRGEPFPDHPCRKRH